MIFVFVEDGTLEVVADLEAVRTMCEPIDVESSVFAFYDADGRPLIPRFTKPNRQTKLLGLISTLEQVEFTLESGSPDSQDPIAVALQETAALEPNPWFENLDAVRKYLAAREAL